MRRLYEMFPYPNRPFFVRPNPEYCLLSHAGFFRWILGNSSSAEALWRRLRGRPGKMGFLASPTALAQAEIAVAQQFDAGKRILLVGCGTDEPLLFRTLHPRNEIVGIDLSPRTLRRARLKLIWGKVSSFLTLSKRNSLFSRGTQGATKLLCGDATQLLHHLFLGQFDHIQCFGVLHHQPQPELLFRAMVDRLAPGGTFRVMVYSHQGRRLERRIQSRYQPLWDEANHGKWGLLRLRMRHFILWIWQVKNILWSRRKNAATSLRFRYLGLSRAQVADALLHPSDPGLPPEQLLTWAENARLDLIFCEARVDSEGWVSGFHNPKAVWQKIVEADKKDGLLSNIVAVFRRPTGAE